MNLPEEPFYAVRLRLVGVHYATQENMAIEFRRRKSYDRRLQAVEHLHYAGFHPS